MRMWARREGEGGKVAGGRVSEGARVRIGREREGGRRRAGQQRWARFVPTRARLRLFTGQRTLPMARKPPSKRSSTPRTVKSTPKPVRPMPISVCVRFMLKLEKKKEGGC